VHSETQRILLAPNLHWHNFDIKATLEEGLNMQVEIDNDANACLLSESWSGRLAGIRNAVLVAISEGIRNGDSLRRSTSLRVQRSCGRVRTYLYRSDRIALRLRPARLLGDGRIFEALPPSYCNGTRATTTPLITTAVFPWMQFPQCISGKHTVSQEALTRKGKIAVTP